MSIPEYKLDCGSITKDGHVMFDEDIVKDLNNGVKKAENYKRQLEDRTAEFKWYRGAFMDLQKRNADLQERLSHYEFSQNV